MSDSWSPCNESGHQVHPILGKMDTSGLSKYLPQVGHRVLGASNLACSTTIWPPESPLKPSVDERKINSIFHPLVPYPSASSGILDNFLLLFPILFAKFLPELTSLLVFCSCPYFLLSAFLPHCYWNVCVEFFLFFYFCYTADTVELLEHKIYLVFKKD